MWDSGRRSERPGRLARAALLTLALLLAALPAGAQDRAGRSTLARLLESMVPGLAVEGLRGPLAGRPGFDRLTISDDQGVWLEITEASLDWSAAALLRRRLQIGELTAARITLHRLPASPPDPNAPAEPGGLLPQLPSLPVALRIDHFKVDRIELAPAVAGEAIALGAEGSARLDSEGLDLSLDAALTEGDTRFTLQAALRPQDGRLQATATLRGPPGGPASRLAGLGERPLSLDLSLDGPAEGARFTLAANAGEGIGADIAGTVAAPDLARLAVTLEGQVNAVGLAPPDLAPLAGPLTLALDTARQPDGRFALRRLHVQGTAGELQAQGELDTEGDGNALTLALTLAESARFGPLLGSAPAEWRSLRIEGALRGALATPELELSLAPEGFGSASAPIAALLGPMPRLEVQASAPDRIRSLTITGQAVRVEASGQIGETLDFAFQAEIAATDQAVPGLSGALSLRGTAAGPIADPTLTLEARSDRLDAAGQVVEALNLTARVVTPASAPTVTAEANGRFQELPLTLTLHGAPAADGWIRFEQAEASFGPARLSASGRVQPAAQLAEGRALLEVGDLAPFSRLAGQPLAGTLRLEAEGSTPEGRQRLAVRLDAPRIIAAGVTAQRLRASAEGSLDALDVTFAGQVQDITAEARGKVTAIEGNARRIDLAALSATGFGETLRLAAPTRVTLHPDGGVELAGATIALPRSGTLRAEGRWGPERADIRATLARLDLAAFAAFAPDIAPSGTVSGEARVTGPTSAPDVAATLQGSRLASGLAAGLPPGELRAELRRAASGLLTVEARATLGAANRLNLSARFPQGPAATAPFTGRLEGALDLGGLSAPLLAAGADRVQGRMTLALTASGTPQAPVLGGSATLSEGSYRNAPRGIALTGIAGTLRPAGDRLIADLSARTAGDGRLTLAGSLAPLAANMPLDLTVTATQATPVSSDLLRATVDANLRLSGAVGTGMTLAGPVTVRRAEIRVPERLGGGVRRLEPVREIGTPPGRAPRPAPRARAPEAAAQPAAPIMLAVEVNALRGVFVRGRGLDAELGGTLGVRGTVAAPEISGALELVRGDLAVVGRRLAFDRGRLAWSGGLLPELDLRATSRTGGTTVAVEVTGPPTAPQIVFSSTPELPQDEILARLLFDRSIRDLSPLEIAQIAAAAAGATGALPSGGGIVDRVRQGLGLDRLAVGSGSETASSTTTAAERSAATLEAGRYVADGVYVGVRQGTQPGSSRVGVRVDLTRRLKLEAETGDREAGNRVGLSYEWEWGR